MAYIAEDGGVPHQIKWTERSHNMTATSDRIVGLMIALSGALIIAIALLAAIDVLAFDGRFHLVAWGPNEPMSVPTSLCFILLGSAQVLIAGLLKSITQKRR